MTDNRQILDDLFANSKIDIRRGDIFDTPPEPMPDDFNFDRVEGMMLGLAIGDALGNTSESSLPHNRKSKHGEIRNYLPNRYANNLTVGLPTDDTQLAFWTLEQMIIDKGFNPDHVAQRFCQDKIFGIGSSVWRFLNNYRSGKKWFESGPESAGNGALMRIAPMIIPHLKSASSELWVDTALSAMITHNDSSSIAACVSFINILWHLLKMDSSPEPNWWLETYVDVAKKLELDKKYRLRTRAFPYYAGPIWQFVEEKVSDAYREKIPIRNACLSWYSGAYLLETVPSVIYILMKHGDNLEQAIVRAINDTKDNDTIGAIVGAAVGALHGRRAIPGRWIKNLLGRTSDKDDGRVFELLAEAKKIWGPSKKRMRLNYKSVRNIYSKKVLPVLSIDDIPKIRNVKTTIDSKFFSIWMQDGTKIQEFLEEEDFFCAFEKIQNKLIAMNLYLKSCGQCRYFGFSSLAYQFSGGEKGYCTLIKELKVNTEDVVHVLDCCDEFELRKKHTEFSPWLPP